MATASFHAMAVAAFVAAREPEKSVSCFMIPNQMVGDSQPFLKGVLPMLVGLSGRILGVY